MATHDNDISYAAVVTTQNSTPNHTSPHDSDLSIDNLYPAIFQCFAIMLAGYIAGRTNVITQAQGKGIGTFVGKFCLPALLFKSMVELNFDTVNWYFLLGIGISKTAVFLGVAVLTLLLKRPLNLGYAGLFGIFATQSNDFALGYPILKALYNEVHPEYLQYIYLVAPISLIFLNPIGFTMLEIHKKKQDASNKSGKIVVVLHVIKDVLINPIVFMVIIGIVGNFLFKQNIPAVIDDILEVLGNAYSASALFYLGLSLVGKVQGQLGLRLVAPMLLIVAKTLLLPLITWQVVGALEQGQMNDSDARSINMYGFLYGTFPTAPSVFLYASHFSIAQDVIATGMVVCTFMSAPIMFASAKMMTVVVNSEMDYKSLLLTTSFDISVISLVCNVWVFAVMFFSSKYRKMPHHFLLCLAFAQSVACIGMIIYDGLDTKVTWSHYLQFVLLLVGVLATRCFAAIISIVLYLLHCRSLCFVLRMKKWMYFFGVGFPVVSTGLLLLFGTHHMHNEIDPSFHYGKDQAILSVIVLALCSVVNITCLVMRHRSSHIHKDPEVKIKPKLGHHGNRINAIGEDDDSLREKLLPDDPVVETPRKTRSSSRSKLLSNKGGSGIGDGAENNRYKSTSCSNCTEDCESMYKPVVRQGSSSIEDIVPFPSDMQRTLPRTTSSTSSTSEDSLTDTVNEQSCLNGTCTFQQRQRCAGLLRCYHATNNVLQVPSEGETRNDEVKAKHTKTRIMDDYQTDRFIILLLFLQISMFVGLFLCTWRIFNKTSSGIYVEIEFLDGFFNFGQSLVVFAIFGFDTQLMVMPCLKRWRRCMYGVETVHVPPKSEISDEDNHLCDQFVKYHMDNCEKSVVKDMKYRFRTYNNVFCGTSLCDWLIEVGLCRDRREAVAYGQTLLRGQIICHVTNEHDFHDMPYFYRFMDEEETA